MESKGNEIIYALLGITTERFSVKEEVYSEKEEITIRTGIRFFPDFEHKLISCFSVFIFESAEKPLIEIEAGCHFQIANSTWDQMIDKATGSLTVPKKFLTHFAVLTVGTTRGILHAKTENARLNQFFLPPVNVSSLIKKDLVIKSTRHKRKMAKPSKNVSK